VAERFGGGGHRAAAGIAFDGNIEQARKAVVEALISELK
jgi:nanoRNase/pAp phosphatase (c-di-AMP/oligoRNAs hydrolase)